MTLPPLYSLTVPLRRSSNATHGWTTAGARGVIVARCRAAIEEGGTRSDRDVGKTAALEALIQQRAAGAAPHRRAERAAGVASECPVKERSGSGPERIVSFVCLDCICGKRGRVSSPE